jgi:hypothetical protein
VDAIVVPTARPVAFLEDAASLALQLECVLVLLCSREAVAADAAEALRRKPGLRFVAIDIAETYEHEWLQFSTAEIPEARWGRQTDTSLKRNLGVLLARMAGWKRIVFLDDDITVADPNDLRRAVALLGTTDPETGETYDCVGLSIGGFPDNSVVCHAHRLTGGTQDTFVGSGALAVAPQSALSFFPDIYNEDWFFLLDKVKLRPVAMVGSATQKAYDPFADPSRAESEEFGDVLAEGVFWLLDRGRKVKDATEAHWTWFLEERRLFIEDITRKVSAHDVDPAERDRMTFALGAAEARRSKISPTLCARYLRAWRADCTRWQRRLNGLPSGLPLEDALEQLGLSSVHTWIPAAPEALPLPELVNPDQGHSSPGGRLVRLVNVALVAAVFARLLRR